MPQPLQMRCQHTWFLVVATVSSLTLGPGLAAAETLDQPTFLRRFEAFDPRPAVLASRIQLALAQVSAAAVRPNPALSLDREDTFANGQGDAQNILKLEVPFDLSGRRAVEMQAAEAGARAVKAEVAGERHQLRLQALALYREAAFARQRVEVLAGQLQGLSAAVETLRKRVAAGHTAGYDLDRLELELADWQARLADAELERTLAEQGLAILVGAAQPVQAEPVVLAEVSTPSALLGLDRADVQAAQASMDQADLEAKAAKRRTLPGLSLSGGMKTQDRQDQLAVGYAVGVSLSLPVFDRGEAQAAVAAARKHQAQAQKTALDLQIPRAIRLAQTVLQLRLDQLRQREQALGPKLERLVVQTESGWRKGERSVFELVDVWRTARDSRLRLLDLRQAASGSELELWRATGKLPWESAK